MIPVALATQVARGSVLATAAVHGARDVNHRGGCHVEGGFLLYAALIVSVILSLAGPLLLPGAGTALGVLGGTVRTVEAYLLGVACLHAPRHAYEWLTNDTPLHHVGLMSHLGSPCVFLWLALQWLLFGSSPIQACDSAVLTAVVVAYGLADFMTWRWSLFPKPASALLFFVACPVLLIPAMDLLYHTLPGPAAAMAILPNALQGREDVAVVASVAVAASSVVVWFLPARHARRRALSSYGTLRAKERGTGHLHHTD
jgi:hypothetical protein